MQFVDEEYICLGKMEIMLQLVVYELNTVIPGFRKMVHLGVRAFYVLLPMKFSSHFKEGWLDKVFVLLFNYCDVIDAK